jgi:hypothetical protein
MNTTITLTETSYIKNPDTKTTYIEVEKEVKEVTEREHYLYFDSVKWFRRLGGSKSITKSYTCNGYVGTKLISTSPDKQIKVVREFNFKSN